MPSEALSPFVIGAEQTQILGDDGASAESFARCRALVCANALDPAFLATLQKVSRRAQFAPDVVEGVGHREIETPNLAGRALTLALKRTNLLRWIEETTRCGPLGGIDGRVAQPRPIVGHRLRWHDDLNVPGRRLAITINLSEQAYEGGMFELRSAATKEALLQYRHAAPGSVLIFSVAPGLDHRVLPLTSGGPRRVYVGWFLQGEQA